MLNKIISFSIKNKLIIGLFIIALVGYGSYQLTKLPIDAVPDITDNQVQVITMAPAFGATDIERLVTFPVEQANSNIPGIKEIRSFSRFGLSLVTIVFDDATDIYWARQQVAERLQQVKANIPKGIGSPELGPITTGLGEIYQYVVRAGKGYEGRYDDMQLRTIQDWIVRRQLLGVKGVADVSSFGGRLKQYEIAVDPARLRSYNITIADVFRALETNNQNTGGAYIEKASTVLYIRSEGLIESMEDIGAIAIKATANGTPLLIKDVAAIRLGHATRYGTMCYNDRGEVAGAVVMMLKGANSSEVIKRVKDRIAQIQKTLPEGVVIEPFLDRTKMVDHAINTVEKNLMEGALIVVFVLVLFLGNVRAGLLVASVIPLSMLFAVIMMNSFGVSGNLMSLGALDFGLIVDGAVIIVEAVMHGLSRNNNFSGMMKLGQREMDQEVTNTASRMMNSAVFGQIIILVVYLPIFTLQGIEGKMFKPMAQTVAFALLGAFLLSLTYVPMMSAVFLNKTIRHHATWSDRLMAKAEWLYKGILARVVQFPKTVLLVVILLFSASVAILFSLGGEFIPTLEEGDFALETRVLVGSNLEVSKKAAAQASRLLLDHFPEVEKVVAKIGSGEIPTDPMPIDAQDLMIILKDKSEWTSAKTFNELADTMGKVLQALPGVTFGFQYPVQMRFNELMTGARQDVVCKIFGEDLDTLALYADRLGNIINTVEGAKDLYVERVVGMPQVIIQYNRAVIAQYDMAIEDINRVVNTAFAGQSSGQVFEGEKRFDMVVRLDNTLRHDLSDVQNLLIPTPQGTQIPLYQLASVEIKTGPNQIQREDARRRIIIGFNVRNRDVQSIVRELQQKVSKQLTLPPGYFVSYGGAFENLEAAKQRLSIAVPISLILIFLLLYFAFGSVRQGLLIYSAIPLSAIGGIFALALRGMPFSISAGVGFIALFGVAVLNGIVLIAEFNRLKQNGMTSLSEIIVAGTQARLRPVLMTAFVASLGFLPMAVSNGAGAEVQRPLATVVIGGLLVATLLTLFVLPILYMLFEKRHSLKPMTNIVPVVLLFGVLAYGSTAGAQTPISLEAAIDTALANNLQVKHDRLKAEYLKQLTRTGTYISQTTLSTEYGQINSRYSDTRFGLAQNINFPTVYTRQKNLLHEEWQTGLWQVAVQEAELRRQVSQTFYTVLYLQEQQQLLQKYDSLYAGFLSKSEQRFSKGESNVLEKTITETQRGQISTQLARLQTELSLAQISFQLLLNVERPVVPAPADFKIEMIAVYDSATVAQHPSVRLLQQQQRMSLANLRLEKARLLPDLTMAYSNMSMQGTGADNLTYNTATRFQSAQLSVGIPLFYGAKKARIASAKVNQGLADINYAITLKALLAEYKGALTHYQQALQTVQYYENSALKNAAIVSETADRQYSNGAINYIEWVMLVNQSITIQNGYINAVKDMNDSIIQINYLLNR